MSTTRTKRNLSAALLSILAIGVSWSIWALTSSASQPHADLPFGRTGIDICVSIAPMARSEVTKTAADRVRVAASAVVQTDAGKELGLNDLPVRVASECPGGYVKPPARADRQESSALRGAVERPSLISTWVFVVDVTGAFDVGTKGFARAPFESSCEQHVCAEVSTALFVTPEVLSSPDALQKAMIVGLGIDPTGGEFPSGHGPELDSVTK